MITTTTTKPTMLRAALNYARHGFAVFPCAPRAKNPMTPHGCKDATTDREVIRHWWGTEPTANIGLATGSLSGLFVLDVDPDHGGAESLAELEANHGGLPKTIASVTGSGGRHLLFKHPGFPVRNRVAVMPGLDFRGDGGYIIAPPSIHPNGRRYRWATELDHPLAAQPVGEQSIAEAPTWLLDLLGPDDSGPVIRAIFSPRFGLPGGRYAKAALHSACAAVELAARGERNATLNSEAFGIGQLVGAGLLDEEDAAFALACAAFKCGLDREEIERTLRSGLRAGMSHPREFEENAA